MDWLKLGSMGVDDFDLHAYLRQFDPRLLLDPAGRRTLTRTNPLLFAILYLRHHLVDKAQDSKITFAECHLDWCLLALTWVKKDILPMENRHAIISPRESGKSSWFYLVLPLWASAHKHVGFAAAFADSATQAEMHLKTFKHELDNNSLLKRDYPDMCKAAYRPKGQQVADNAGMLIQKSGFVFAARGIDAANLGMKVGERRPDLIILDDIEKDEANYSDYKANKRLGTLRDAIFYLNLAARLVLVGTVTMPNSLMHQFVKQAKKQETFEWISEENFQIHYYPAILADEFDNERSLWPAKWSLEFLHGLRGTRSYAKNFENDPVDGADSWWRKDDFQYSRLSMYDRVVLFVDGAVTTKQSSDYTGISVVGLDVKQRKFYILESVGVKLPGEKLREYVLRLIDEYKVHYMMIEANQGGDLWHTVFHNMPIISKVFTQKERKEYRLRRLLAAYQRGKVFHAKELPQLERQELAYPTVVHDDIVDSAAAGVQHLSHMLFRELKSQGKSVEVRKLSYV